MDAGVLGGIDKVFFQDGWVPQGEVVPDCARKNRDILAYGGNAGMDDFWGQAFHIDAVQLDFSFPGAVETAQHFGYGRLPAAGRAYESYGITGI